MVATSILRNGRVVRRLGLAALLGPLLFGTVAATATSPDGPGTTIVYEHGRLSGRIRNTPLSAVLDELTRVTGIRIAAGAELGDEPISMEFDALSVADAVAYVLRGQSYFLVLGSKVGRPVPGEVALLPVGPPAPPTLGGGAPFAAAGMGATGGGAFGAGASAPGMHFGSVGGGQGGGQGAGGGSGAGGSDASGGGAGGAGGARDGAPAVPDGDGSDENGSDHDGADDDADSPAAATATILAATAGDFDGDGRMDLAALVPATDETARPGTDVVVLRGSDDGPARPETLLRAPKAGADAPPPAATLAAADLDGDGCAELAIGRPAPNAGSVEIVRGSPRTGLVVKDALVLRGASDASGNDRFGQALAAGDFDADGAPDLAVGIASTAPNASGRVAIVFGSPTGLLPDARDTLTSEHERFGQVLASGDFDGDGIVDLAVGVRGVDAAAPGANAVLVYRGSAGGLERDPQTLLAATTADRGERFGELFVAGNFDGAGTTDLVVAAPRGGDERTGRVFLLRGGAGTVEPNPAIELDAGEGSRPASGDRFGELLAAGDFTGDGVDDLVAVVQRTDAGEVLLFAGEAHQGLSPKPSRSTRVRSDRGQADEREGRTPGGR